MTTTQHEPSPYPDDEPVVQDNGNAPEDETR